MEQTEHFLFVHDHQMARQATALRSYRTIVQVLAAYLKVRAELGENGYPSGVKVSDAEMAAVNLTLRIPRRLELHECAS